MTQDELVAWLKAQTKGYGAKLALARRLGIHPSYLTEVLRGSRPPGKKITNGLGLRRVVTYEPTVSAWPIDSAVEG